MQRHEQLLLENKAWAQEKTEVDTDFFERIAAIQRPDFLWIGCSDSRVSPTEITQTQPGEIFIHRNIANLVISTDLNLLSVVQYAVEVLEIKHIIVCGHYGCGGIKSALARSSFGIIDHWLQNIKDVYRLHQKQVDHFTTEEERVNCLVECNVREQLLNLAKTSLIQKAWQKNKRPLLHGWVYNIRNGIINPVLELAPDLPLPHPLYEYDNIKAEGSNNSNRAA